MFHENGNGFGENWLFGHHVSSIGFSDTKARPKWPMFCVLNYQRGLYLAGLDTLAISIKWQCVVPLWVRLKWSCNITACSIALIIEISLTLRSPHFPKCPKTHHFLESLVEKNIYTSIHANDVNAPLFSFLGGG